MRVLDTPFHELPEYRIGAIDAFGSLKVNKTTLPESFVFSLIAKKKKWFFSTNEKIMIAESISELCGNLPSTPNKTVDKLIQHIVNDASRLAESEAPVNVSAADSPTPPDANIQTPDILMKPPKKKRLCGYDKVVCESGTQIKFNPDRPTLYICGDFKLLAGV